MTRNGVIVGLSRGLVVVEAGEKGGTLNAGIQAIEGRRPVYALELSGGATPAGNVILFERGARRVRSRQQLGAILDEVATVEPAADLPLRE